MANGDPFRPFNHPGTSLSLQSIPQQHLTSSFSCILVLTKTKKEKHWNNFIMPCTSMKKRHFVVTAVVLFLAVLLAAIIGIVVPSKKKERNNNEQIVEASTIPPTNPPANSGAANPPTNSGAMNPPTNSGATSAPTGTIIQSGEIIQLGSGLFGSNVLDFFGTSIAINSDGSRMAANADNGEDSGHVRVFEWTETEWEQMGPALVGEAAGDSFGISIALSSSGNRVAIGGYWNDGGGLDAGHVRIYDWTEDESQWSQVGSDLNGLVAGEFFGYDVALSSNGDRVAIGSFSFTGGGVVRIYDLIENQWIQAGEDLEGGADQSRLGISSDGNRLVIGSVEVAVRVYDWTGSQWTVASQLSSDEFGDGFGWFVALSADGNRLVVSASYTSPPTIRTYDWADSKWTEMGSWLETQGTHYHVYLSSDGSRLIVGEFEDSFRIKIYDWAGDQWTLVASQADGFEESIAMSSNGNRFAAGNGVDEVRVYELA
jgi:hypothetical protein